MADDACIMAHQTELPVAHTEMIETLADWEDKTNQGKTEDLVLVPGGRNPYDVRNRYEKATVRHVGGVLHEGGATGPDTTHRASAGMQNVRRIASIWAKGSKRGTGDHDGNRGVKRSTRIRVMEAVIPPTLTSFARSRRFTRHQIEAYQRVVNYAVRRAMGITIYDMRDHHITDLQLHNFTKMQPMLPRVQYLSLK